MLTTWYAAIRTTRTAEGKFFAAEYERRTWRTIPTDYSAQEKSAIGRDKASYWSQRSTKTIIDYKMILRWHKLR